MSEANITYKLVKKIKITGEITLVTGLCIGGTDTGMEIGGIDKTIVRNPLTGEPYIPGSSLKGKLRAMLELHLGAIKQSENGNGFTGSDDPKFITTRLFGNSRGDEKQRPSRLIVRDCSIDKEIFEGKDLNLPFAEVKTEVVIDRITAKATPRTIERVPAGAKFKMEMILNLFEENGVIDNEEDYKKAIKDAINLLENDYLGGNGSRGYGQVKFEKEKLDFKDVKL